MNNTTDVMHRFATIFDPREVRKIGDLVIQAGYLGEVVQISPRVECNGRTLPQCAVVRFPGLGIAECFDVEESTSCNGSACRLEY